MTKEGLRERALVNTSFKKKFLPSETSDQLNGTSGGRSGDKRILFVQSLSALDGVSSLITSGVLKQETNGQASK